MFEDKLNVQKDSKLNNHIVRKSAWLIFLVLCLAMTGAVISVYIN